MRSERGSKTAALQKLAEERPERDRERAEIEAARRRSSGAAAGATSEQTAKDVLQPAAAAASTGGAASEKSAEQVLEATAALAATAGALRQAPQQIVESTHR